MAKDTLSDKKLSIMGACASLVTLTIFIFLFYRRMAYIEHGHGFIIIAYIVLSSALFFCIRKANATLSVLCLVLMIGTHIYSSSKFDWREDYIANAIANRPFALEPLITEYPVYEDYLFSSFTGRPNWVKLSRECFEPAIAGNTTGPRCTSFETIQTTYNVDLLSAFKQYFGKMRTTAKKIADGSMVKRDDLVKCLASKQCVPVPLLPKGVEAKSIDPSSKDYISLRKAFWSLVNDEKLSNEACSLDQLCRALVTMKLIEVNKIPF